MKLPWSRRNRKPKDCLLPVGPGPEDWLGFEQYFSNIFISGMIGSSKTTGIGAHLALSILGHESRPGGLVLCQKPDEADRFVRYARAVGRERDIVRVTPGGPHVIDVIDYTLTSRGGSPEEAARVLEVILEVSNRNQQRTSSDSYWPDSSVRQMKAAMTLLPMAGLSCGLPEVLEFCSTQPTVPLPTDDDPAAAPDPTWRGYAANVTLAAGERYESDPAFRMASNLVCDEWPKLSDKTRSIVQSVTTNTLEKLLSSPFARVIAGGETTLTPEMVYDDGKIALLDLPPSVYGPPAAWAQVAIKLLFQRAAMRRDISGTCRPAFLWCDEAANFAVPSQDSLFLSQSRQFRVICTNIVQNFPLIQTALGGGDVARQNAAAWISNHAILVAAAQAEAETNKFFSELFGETRELFYGGSSGVDEQYDAVGDILGTRKRQGSASWSQQIRPAVPPHEFAKLLRGGAANGFCHEAYVFVNGHRFSNGQNWIRATFPQWL